MYVDTSNISNLIDDLSCSVHLKLLMICVRFVQTFDWI